MAPKQLQSGCKLSEHELLQGSDFAELLAKYGTHSTVSRTSHTCLDKALATMIRARVPKNRGEGLRDLWVCADCKWMDYTNGCDRALFHKMGSVSKASLPLFLFNEFSCVACVRYVAHWPPCRGAFLEGGKTHPRASTLPHPSPCRFRSGKTHPRPDPPSPRRPFATVRFWRAEKRTRVPDPTFPHPRRPFVAVRFWRSGKRTCLLTIPPPPKLPNLFALALTPRPSLPLRPPLPAPPTLPSSQPPTAQQ